MEENNYGVDPNELPELLEATEKELREARKELNELKKQCSEARQEAKNYQGWYKSSQEEIELLRHLIKGFGNADLVYVLEHFSFYKRS